MTANTEDEEKFRTEVQLKLSHLSYELMDNFMTELSQKLDTIIFWYKYITDDYVWASKIHNLNLLMSRSVLKHIISIYKL